MKSANYKLPAYLMVLMSVIGFTLLCAANAWQLNVLYVGLGFLGLFVLIYSILVLCSMGDKFLVLIAFMLMTVGFIISASGTDFGFCMPFSVQLFLF